MSARLLPGGTLVVDVDAQALLEHSASCGICRVYGSVRCPNAVALVERVIFPYRTPYGRSVKKTRRPT